MKNRERLLSLFFKMVSGIGVEILATIFMMAAVFAAGIIILRCFSR